MPFFSAIFLSAVSAFALSRFIDFLYSRPNSPLTFPEKKINLLIRFSCLFLLLFCTFFYFQNLYKTIFTIFLLIITITDFEQYVIFDIVILPFALSGIVTIIVFDLPLVERLLAALFAGSFFLALLVLTKNGIGGGDVKLVATLGLWLGADKLISTILTASILGGVCALFLILCGIKRRTDFFAYGPYFCIAAAFHFLH